MSSFKAGIVPCTKLLGPLNPSFDLPGKGNSPIGLAFISAKRQAPIVRNLRLTIVVILASIAFLSGAYYLFHRIDRERRYDALIDAAADDYGIDPALVKAVIWRESKFNPNARGAAGEIGLMQIRDAAAFDWAGEEKNTDFELVDLENPQVNIRVGTWYLADLLKRYQATDDPIPYALADYNAGRTRVLRWMRGPAQTNHAEFLAGMDFPGTRRYIETVRRRYHQYQRKSSEAGNQ